MVNKLFCFELYLVQVGTLPSGNNLLNIPKLNALIVLSFTSAGFLILLFLFLFFLLLDG